MLGVDLRGPREVVPQHVVVVDDFHPAPTQDVGRAHQHGIADLLGNRAGFGKGECRAETRRGKARTGKQGTKLRAILCSVDGLG